MIAASSLTAEQRERIHRAWVPCAFLLIHNETVSTTLRFTPMHVSRDADVTYRPSFRVYEKDPNEVAWEKIGPSMPLESVWSVTSAEIAEAMGRKTLFHYGEDHHVIEQREPVDAINTLVTYVHYHSTDGSMMGYIGAFQIFGASVKMLKGDYYYNNFPGVQLDEDFSLKIFSVNPFTRSSPYSVILVDRNGRQIETEMMRIGGKSGHEWSSRSLDLRGFESPFGVIVKSELKVSSIYATVNSSNKMVSVEHGHPFFSYVLNHGSRRKAGVKAAMARLMQANR
jgi:hypothetical protein